MWLRDDVGYPAHDFGGLSARDGLKTVDGFVSDAKPAHDGRQPDVTEKVLRLRPL